MVAKVAGIEPAREQLSNVSRNRYPQTPALLRAKTIGKPYETE
jgi:hypothetical protein